MDQKIPQVDPIKAYQRLAAAERGMGVNTKCTYCNEARPWALNRNSTPTSCEQCERQKKGKTTMDQHHIAGAANSPITTSVPVNDHRADLTAAQLNWPKETLGNPDGCPLLRAAASIRGFVDTVIYYMREFLIWIAELLELLSAHLKEQWGRRWWRNTKFKRFAPKGGSRGRA